MLHVSAQEPENSSPATNNIELNEVEREYKQPNKIFQEVVSP